jgi:hypothetical protein
MSIWRTTNTEFVDLYNDQNIEGIKNFTGTLMINGTEISEVAGSGDLFIDGGAAASSYLLDEQLDFGGADLGA